MDPTAIGMLFLGTALTFITTWFWQQRNAAIRKAETLALDNEKTISRIVELESRLALVNQAVIPISMAFQAILIKELTHFHTPEMDALMVKIGPPNVLSAAELDRLELLLGERAVNMAPEISESERDAAVILPYVVRRAQQEAETLTSAESLKIKLVTVAAIVGVPNLTDHEDDRRIERRMTDVHTAQQRRVTDASKDATLASGMAVESLKHIDTNTAKTADALTALKRRATDQLASKVRDAMPDTPHGQVPR